MADVVCQYGGVNFNNLRKALYIIIFGVGKVIGKDAKGNDIHECDDFNSDNYKYIIPMSASWENPLNQADAKDTYLQFWIEKDEELTQDDFLEVPVETTDPNKDYGLIGYSRQKRVAQIYVRTSGKNAESWSKIFYHLCQRKDVSAIWGGVCNAERLLYTSPCRPITVDYFGKSTSIAFDVRFSLLYDETLQLNWNALNGVHLTVDSTIFTSQEPNT